MVPALVFLLRRRDACRVEATQKLVTRLSSINIIIAVLLLGVGSVWLLSPETVMAAGLAQEATGNPWMYIAAAISVSVGSISAGYAVSTTGSAAIGAIAEKPDIFGKALIFVGLAEGVAIYGLIIAFIMLNS